ncbi:hypothetical protein KL930_001717 [Ogataea haglerorum]|uniref:Siderophore iron transporter 1 n=1 Tax=Ogataea haglerorum TaxID=1937702 RepID=A0AAN6I1V1_9ASCO|nr:hypothetical protein KL914_002003 [Ogataea haglerorum]KAG7710696.1 hypothetical protein KL950_001609 [Ogataea haglerorum]KAG7729921.1 hypothetical protein KL933_001001 [Ogataea haglerorum]KAG7732652.1 hypothetical protein KL948_002082 [Ogataea haglerorum]KAG7760283.1 hypothetical protein KL947_001127 [Ogataea haglerorum]
MKYFTNTEKDTESDVLTKANSKYEPKSYGVRRTEALNKQYDVWYGKVAVFFSIFLVAYAYGLDGQIRSTYQSYATSSYAQHSLLSTVTVVRSVAACVAQLFYARLSDIFGRIELLFVGILLYVVGTIIESQAYDVTRFAAGAILYQFGYSGVIVLLQIISADFSNMNWRVLASFVAALPFVINTWISGNVTDSVLASRTWSWGIGMWAFIFPLACIPLILCFMHMHYLAYRNGDIHRLEGVTDFKRLGLKRFMIETFFWKVDLVGLLCLMLSLGLILTPFTLAGGYKSEWQKAKVIAPLVIGFCLFPFFFLWEAKYAKHPFLEARYMKDASVWGALMIAIYIDLVWYMQGDYLYTVLVVAFNQSVKSATRITSLYSFVSVITGTILGFAIAFIRRLKAFIIFGISMWFIALGLMIKYRGGDGSKDGLIGAQCLLGFGAGFFTYVTQASIQTVADHEHMATLLSLYLCLYYVGSALGGSISGAVWTQILPKEINKRISNATEAALAYGSPLTWIYEHPWGSPERMALVASYKHVQRILVAIGLAFCGPLLSFAFLLKDPKLESVQSLKDAHPEVSEEEEVESQKITA